MLSHSHLDHCGAIPKLYKSGNPPFFATQPSIDIYQIMIEDSMKVSRLNGFPTPFGKREVRKSLEAARPVNYGESFYAAGFKTTFYDAGHIPGSAGILLEKSGRSIFYTGDTNDRDTYLLNGAVYPEKVDYLIIESTYYNREHPDRKSEERRFIEAVKEGLANNEVVLIPAFALGRAQEILIMLHKNGFRDIYLDGMAKKLTDLFLYHYDYLRDSTDLEKAMKDTIIVEGNRQRKELLEGPKIVVTTAGMMTGGPIIQYMKQLHGRPSRVLFTGYLIEDTPGRRLLETGIFSNDEVSMEYPNIVMKFDFSAHIGRSGLFNLIERLKPKKVFCIHGDNPGEFAEEIQDRLGIWAEAPSIGEEYEL